MTSALLDGLQDGASRVTHKVSAGVRRQRAEYLDGAEQPMAGYLRLLATYGAAVGLGGVAARRRGLPAKVDWSDVALIAVATHKLSRLLAKDPVTSPFRAPFTRFQGPAGEGELHEQVRDGGARKAVGELVTCPFCLGQWVATAFVFGLVLAPRATRLAATVFTALTASDFLQLAYAAAMEKVDG
jgi:hypothetical protein